MIAFNNILLAWYDYVSKLLNNLICILKKTINKHESMWELQIHKNQFQIHVEYSSYNSLRLYNLTWYLFALSNLYFDFLILFLWTHTLSTWLVDLFGYLCLFFRKETKLLHISAKWNLALFILMIWLLLWRLLQKAWLIMIVGFFIRILSGKNRRCKDVIIFIGIYFLFL